MAGTPITFTLYDPKTDEVKKEYRRSFIPWKLLKEAVKVSKLLNKDKEDESSVSEETVDQLAGLVVAVFGDQFSIEDLNNGADVTEMISVIQQIVNKANGIIPNPPPAG